MSPVRDAPEIAKAATSGAHKALRELVHLLARQAARDALCDQVDHDTPDAVPTNKPTPR